MTSSTASRYNSTCMYLHIGVSFSTAVVNETCKQTSRADSYTNRYFSSQ